NQDVIFSISEKIRNIVEQTEIVYPQTGELVSITVSIGATLWDPDDSISSIIARADNALYQAKQLGRNQSVISIN
nr:diguanylate cyclase [Desulfitobacterium hafniense]